MKQELIKKFNDEELLNEICEIYGYELKKKGNQILCIIEGGNEDEEETYKYSSIEEGLVDWLDTLEESERNYIENGDNITWASEINHIKELRKGLIADNKAYTLLHNALSYGEVPSFMKSKLSNFIEQQNSKADKSVNYLKAMDRDIIATKTTIPVEFILLNNELKYIKVAHEEFLNRLIFDKDTSEIEFNEQYMYDKNGLLNFAPLLPMKDIKKFELNIPVSVRIISNCKSKIETPINYKDLF